MGYRNLMTLGAAALIAGSSALALGQSDDNKDNTSKRTSLGVKVGVYFPTNSEIKDIFGSSIVAFGISVDNFSKQADKWRLTVDFDFITGKNDDDKFFVLPVTASFGRVFGTPDSNVRPYVRFGVGGAYKDYSITRRSTLERFSNKTIGFSADAETGFFIGDKFKLAAKYVWLSKNDDFDFSGFQITATYNILKF